jgi:hypothetical protein
MMPLRVQRGRITYAPAKGICRKASARSAGSRLPTSSTTRLSPLVTTRDDCQGPSRRMGASESM